MDDFENFDVIAVIGSGSFGTCYKVKHKVLMKEYVWKAINYGKMSEERKQSVVSEVNVLSKLRHPNIIRYFDHIIHKKSSTLYIIMEYCSGGDLSKTIMHCLKTSQLLNEIFIWRILYQISSALDVCHSQCAATILHRDIKPANVFIDSDYNVKLGDFGLAKILEEKNFTDTFVGTPLYMSPEQMKNKKYDEKSDVWALGCLIYEACALKPPFMGKTLKNLSHNIKEGVFSRIPSYYSEELYKLVIFMLSTDLEYRPTVDIILRHPVVILKSGKEIKNIYQPLPKSQSDTETNYGKFKINLESKFSRSDDLQNLEQKMSDNLQVRLENIRNREAANKLREEKLNEKERALNKREKKIALMERLATEKVARANLYLKKSKDKKKPCFEELDTSCSADPGDTSILPTSVKINEENVLKPKNFIRTKSERRVHFTARKVFEEPTENIILKEYLFDKNSAEENNPIKQKRNIFKVLNDKITQSSSSLGSKSSSNCSEISKISRPLSWTEENKRCAFSLLKIMNTESDKENITSKITHTKM